MARIEEALNSLRERSEHDPARKGKAFERMVRRALAEHTGEYGKQRFKWVKMWSDWEGNDGRGDHGIDLVAEETDGGLCAIQCKFYDSTEVPRKEIDAFLAASEGKFASRIFVSTSEISKQGLSHIETATPRCEMLYPADMDDWVADWVEWLDKPDELRVSMPRHDPYAEQEEALAAIQSGFAECDRGKLIWPCGTGKSLVGMWAAERTVGEGGSVLYLVPSISLMGQTMREWARHRTIAHSYLGVCSDVTTGRRDDDSHESITGLAMPVSTNVGDLAEALEQPVGNKMRVVFCTYQSAQVVADALLKSGKKFDLAICDEAHRTTGLAAIDKTSAGQQSSFTLIHGETSIVADLRLFMTATPRVYTERAKRKAKNIAEQEGPGWDVDSYSMDDETVYGPVFHEMTFAEAIEKELLSDYQVVVVAAASQPDGERPIKLDDQGKLAVTEQQAVKLLGCWDALADPATVDSVERAGRRTGLLSPDNEWARAAILFANKVKTSKALAEHWSQLTERHQAENVAATNYLKLDVEHIDGTTSAAIRASRLNELKASRTDDGGDGERVCKVLTNARVLTEGVDVPALDAVIFFEPRTSKIDITQAVGRVMRRADDKDKGRVVVPVIVPHGKKLSDPEVLNGPDFKVVLEVVRALRSHDERIDYWINHPKTALSQLDDERIVVLDSGDTDTVTEPEQLRIAFSHVRQAVASKLVESCGDRKSWINWGQKAAEISDAVHKQFLDAITHNPEAKKEFARFVEWMRTTINPSVDEDQAAEMVAQHIVTIPIFDHIFKESLFAHYNPVSQAVEKLIDIVDPKGNHFAKELAPLKRAYDSMRKTFDGALTSAERVDVLRQIYDGFFAAAMKDTVDRLGLVYTPVELVDFMLRSADAVCRQEFGVGLGNKGVNILDPFTGTGTFVYRLLTGSNSQGEPFIPLENLHHKYMNELHANEIVLLAYYIAALKIEAGYTERDPEAIYQEFPGIVLGDTFLISDEERQRQLEGMQSGKENSERGLNQATTEIQVILSNPPWSAGQKSSGDDNPNIEYEHIAERVLDTYVSTHKEITGKPPGGNASGNLYIQAIRWASDRLDDDEGGVIAFVHPNSLATGTSLAGARAVLRNEFTDIYVVNLRGNAYTSTEEFRKEGDKIFGSGSRNGVQITVLVRNPAKPSSEPATLRYAQVPDGQSLDEKLNWLHRLGNVCSAEDFDEVPVTASHDWVNLTDGTFEGLLAVCDSDKNNPKVALSSHASGIATACDSYVYAWSRDALVEKVERLIEEFNDAWEMVDLELSTLEEATVNDDLDKIKWTGRLKSSLKSAVKNQEPLVFDESRIREVLYRPFIKKWLYEDYRIVSAGKTVSKMFPRDMAETGGPPPHRILVSTPSSSTIFTVLAADRIGDLKSGGIAAACRYVPRWRE